MSEKQTKRRERSQKLISSAIQTVDSRESSYGEPYHDMCRTAKIWSAILGCDVSPSAVPLCMIGLKLSRATNSYKDDNGRDIVGYTQVYEEVIAAMEEKKDEPAA